MKTMYKAYGYTCDGYTATAFELTNGYVATYEEAKEATAKTHHGAWETGDWTIEATTMDEETFTYKTETIAHYDWYNEVGQWKHYEYMIGVYTDKVAKAEAIKPKTEKGEQRKQKQIEEAKKDLAYYEEALAKWPA